MSTPRRADLYYAGFFRRPTAFVELYVLECGTSSFDFGVVLNPEVLRASLLSKLDGPRAIIIKLFFRTSYIVERSSIQRTDRLTAVQSGPEDPVSSFSFPSTRISRLAHYSESNASTLAIALFASGNFCTRG